MAQTSLEGPVRAGIGGTVTEIGSALAAIIAACLALTAIGPWPLASIATILAGVALLFEGVRIATRFRVAAQAAARGRVYAATGISMEVVGGIVGIALGVLALSGLVPPRSVAIAAIVFGGSIIFGSAGTESRYRTGDAPVVFSGVELACGIAAVALGVSALLGVAPRVLALLGVLCVSAGVLLNAAVTRRTTARDRKVPGEA